MPIETPLPLIVNSLALSLSLSFLIIILWYDVSRSVNQFFALFLLLVVVWTTGFLLSEVSTVLADSTTLNVMSVGLTQLGFTGAGIALYALLSILVGVQPRRFRLLVAFYFLVVVGYTVLIVRDTSLNDAASDIRAFALLFFAVFDGLAMYIVWRYRRKIRSVALAAGAVLFVIGQGSSFLNPALGVTVLSTTISAVGTVLMSFAFVQRELITPLLNRGKQLEAMHEVSLAVTSRFTTDAVLNEIAERGATWLQADAAGIFLTKRENLRLVAGYQLPQAAIGTELTMGAGLAGQVATRSESIYLENYSRDWHGTADLPLAKETFGSVIGVPLIYAEHVIGTLLVIAGTQSTLLDKSDVELLELLAAQAAVAISHGQLFTEQKRLTEQLETVLSSTESPVVAVDRQLRLIFANPAAEKLLGFDASYQQRRALNLLPSEVLPDNYRQVVRNIRQQRAHIYEVNLNDKTYLCHLASLGDERIEGWVAVLNDVTELKELDRIKSEMIRMTSHDLKNPLQAAMANLELLRDDVSDYDNSEITLSVDTIEKQLNKMYRIIQGILDLERVRLSSQLSDVCHPQAVIDHAVDELSDMISDHDTDVHVSIAPDVGTFVGDREKFERALVNLIENAIKFNQAPGDVRITVETQENEVLFTISDTGIGIPSEKQSKIFDRFYRGHQRGAEHITGTGLGLSLVKAVVDSHNGRIWVESEPDVGTTFSIALPVATQNNTLPS